MSLHVQWAGSPLLRTISAFEAQPVTCGSLPCVGGHNETVAMIGRPETHEGLAAPARVRPADRARILGFSRGASTGPARGAEASSARRAGWSKTAVMKDGSPLIQLRGGDVLQYDAEALVSTPMEGACVFASGCGDGRSAPETRAVSKKHVAPGCCSTPGTVSAGHFGDGGSTQWPSSPMRTGRLRFSVQSQN